MVDDEYITEYKKLQGKVMEYSSVYEIKRYLVFIPDSSYKGGMNVFDYSNDKVVIGKLALLLENDILAHAQDKHQLFAFYCHIDCGVCIDSYKLQGRMYLSVVEDNYVLSASSHESFKYRNDRISYKNEKNTFSLEDLHRNYGLISEPHDKKPGMEIEYNKIKWRLDYCYLPFTGKKPTDVELLQAGFNESDVLSKTISDGQCVYLLYDHEHGQFVETEHFTEASKLTIYFKNLLSLSQKGREFRFSLIPDSCILSLDGERQIEANILIDINMDVFKLRSKGKYVAIHQYSSDEFHYYVVKCEAMATIVSKVGEHFYIIYTKDKMYRIVLGTLDYKEFRIKSLKECQAQELFPYLYLDGNGKLYSTDGTCILASLYDTYEGRFLAMKPSYLNSDDLIIESFTNTKTEEKTRFFKNLDLDYWYASNAGGKTHRLYFHPLCEAKRMFRYAKIVQDLYLISENGIMKLSDKEPMQTESCSVIRLSSFHCGKYKVVNEDRWLRLLRHGKSLTFRLTYDEAYASVLIYDEMHGIWNAVNWENTDLNIDLQNNEFVLTQGPCMYRMASLEHLEELFKVDGVKLYFKAEMKQKDHAFIPINGDIFEASQAGLFLHITLGPLKDQCILRWIKNREEATKFVIHSNNGAVMIEFNGYKIFVLNLSRRSKKKIKKILVCLR